MNHEIIAKHLFMCPITENQLYNLQHAWVVSNLCILMIIVASDVETML